MVGLLPRAVCEAERVKDLQTATLQAVGLAAEDLGVSLVNDASLDTAVRHPRGSHQPIRRLIVSFPVATVEKKAWPPPSATA